MKKLKYVINPVESRLASFDKPDTLKIASDEPADIAVIRALPQCQDMSSTTL